MSCLGIKNIGTAKMRSEYLSDFRPSHQLVYCEKLEELGIGRYLGVAGVFVDTVKKVGLFVVVGCENDIVDDPL